MMLRFLLPLALVAMLVAPTPALAVSLPPPMDELEYLLVSDDPDGGRTLRLLIEDGPGGAYQYTRVDARNTHETLGGLVGRVDPATGAAIAAMPEAIEEAGAYTHAWTRGASPMLTLGVYVIHADEGLLRAPVVLFENVTSTDALLAAAQALVTDEGLDMALQAVPFLTEYALPEFSGGFQNWPAGPGSVNTFRDYPRVYAWTLHKSGPAGEVWEGAYLERLGAYTGGFSSAEDFDGVKSVEVGAALRLDDATTRVAGAYVETVLHKTAGNPQAASQRVTVGTATEETGRVPLAGVDLADERAGTFQFSYPQEQRSGIVLGAYVQGQWTPLLGTWTEAQHEVQADGDVQQWRTTSVGPYVQGAYTPAAGFRYHGDRSPLLAWVSGFAAQGPGTQDIGDWQLDVGGFVDGTFVPLAGATYADDFAGAMFTYQAMLTLGVHGPLGYQPVLGLTYDGQRPLLTWARGWAEARRNDALDWMVSVGTFAGPAYVPLLGARYDNAAPGAERAWQEHYTVGTYAADYRAFIPLAGATYDGDLQHAVWAQAFAQGGTLGAPGGDWDANAGTYVMGAWQPLAGVQVRDDYGPGYAAQTFVTIGVWAGPEFVPLVGLSYSSALPLVPSLRSPSSLADDARAFATVGVFVQGDYVPLVVVENNGAYASVGLLPPYY